MTKPLQQDINRTFLHLQKQDITRCAICYKENDNSTNDYLNWVQCSLCDILVHETYAQEQMIHMTSYVKHIFLVLAIYTCWTGGVGLHIFSDSITLADSYDSAVEQVASPSHFIAIGERYFGWTEGITLPV